MAEDRPITPEKQLLKLIEDQGAVPAASKKTPAVGAASFSSLRGLLAGRYSFWKRSMRKSFSWSRMAVDLTWANRLLAVALAALLIYTVTDIVSSSLSLQKAPNFAFQNEKNATSASGSGVVSPLKEAAYYLEKVNARDLFREGGRSVSSAEPRQAAPAPAENEAFRDLSLVGISWSSNPDVIIEDKTKQRTFFVKRGQTVGDGFKVEAVFKDHVILSLDGQEFELR